MVGDETGIYVAGLSLDTQPSIPEVFGFVLRLNLGGEELWRVLVKGTGRTEVSDVALDSTGVYVVGQVEGVLSGQDNLGRGDAFLRKYTMEGVELWTRQFGTSARDEARAVAVTPRAVFVAGWTDGTLSGQTRSGGPDAFLGTYSPEGEAHWTLQFGTANDDRSVRLISAAEEVYAGWVSAGPPLVQCRIPEGCRTLQGLLRASASDGTEHWTIELGALQLWFLGIAISNTGIYAVTWDPWERYTDFSQSNVTLYKYGFDGGLLWSYILPVGEIAGTPALAADDSGVYVGGTRYVGYQGDAFVRKFGSGGDSLWARHVGFANSSVHALEVNPTGLYAAGAISTPNRTVDAFVVRITDYTPSLVPGDVLLVLSVVAGVAAGGGMLGSVFFRRRAGRPSHHGRDPR